MQEGGSDTEEEEDINDEDDDDINHEDILTDLNVKLEPEEVLHLAGNFVCM